MVTGQLMLAVALCVGALAWLCAGDNRAAHRGWMLLAGGTAVGARREGRAGTGSAGSWAGTLAGACSRAWVRLRGRARREWLCLAAALALAVVGESLLPLLAGAAAVPLARRWLRAGERRRERDRREDAVIALCGAVAGELRAGAQPGEALRFGACATGALRAEEAAVLAAARFGGDVPGALRRAARMDGADGLVGLAACWQVAVDGGAGLAAGLERLEGALRDRREQRERLRAQLSGTWATVVLLAVLPLAGLGMGAVLGAEPLRVLLHTPVGLICLVVGVALEAAGLWWASRIVRAGEGT